MPPHHQTLHVTLRPNRLKLPKFTGASWQHRWVSGWMKGIFRRTIECLKFFSLSSGVVSVPPTMVVWWLARRLEREHRQTSSKRNGSHGLVAHPDSKWWWRNQGKSLPWIQDILQKQWPQDMLRNSRQGPYLSAGGNSFSSIWGGQCWIMEGLHSG